MGGAPAEYLADLPRRFNAGVEGDAHMDAIL